eukprot:COSAG06_NODE_1850_length_8215_cov_51.160917_7_plen_80_part_00
MIIYLFLNSDPECSRASVAPWLAELTSFEYLCSTPHEYFSAGGSQTARRRSSSSCTHNSARKPQTPQTPQAGMYTARVR